MVVDRSDTSASRRLISAVWSDCRLLSIARFRNSGCTSCATRFDWYRGLMVLPVFVESTREFVQFSVAVAPVHRRACDYPALKVVVPSFTFAPPAKMFAGA